MEELEGVMFDEGDFEVVDECTGEEDPSPVPIDTDKQTDNSENRQDTAESANAPENVDKQQMGTEAGSATPSKPKASDEPDFTVDVAMDQLDASKVDTMDDDAICLDASDVVFLEAKDGETKADGENVDDSKETDSVVELIPPEHAWYEEKLNAKMTIVKERLSKLARVLELSYPAYKPWLEHSQTSVCHLDPPRRCPLDKPHTNRWKFICSRKTVQESTNKEEDSAEGTVNKKLETVWRLGPTDGSGVNTDNASQYPPFVMRVVKVFEEFIQSVEQSADDEPAAADQEQPPADVKPSVDEKGPLEMAPNDASSANEAQETSMEEIKVDEDITEETIADESTYSGDRNHNWLWLLVRSNSKDELMVFATGKKISEATMQKLKQTFETGPGKDCNVKSLYCKSIHSKSGNTATSNITFLAGTEALDESVGGVKIQLAPKTNFWSNASGVEQLGAAVGDMLSPLQKTTVVEVGCGLGLIGLMLAPKSKKVIGLDAPSEVEEAEMTSELNKIKNASFITGQPGELMTKLTNLLKSTRAAAIVNGNTKLGRDIEVMTALRNIPSLRRVVMITTLTKQSVRAILELTRPVDGDLGNPFMPLRAILVDTLPTGPHFEVVIRMERLNMEKINEPWFWNHVKFRAGLSPNEQPRKNPPQSNKATVQAKKGGVKVTPGGNAPNPNRRSNNRASRRNKMKKQKSATQGIVLGTVTGVVRNPPLNMVKNAAGNLVKNPMASVSRAGKTNQPKGKTSSSDKSNAARKSGNNKPGGSQSSSQPANESPASPDPLKPVKVAKSSKAPNPSPLKKNPLAKVQAGRGQRLSGAQKRKRHWAMVEAQRQGGGVGNHGPAEKRMRGNGNQGDLRGRLSDPRMMQQVHEQQMILNMAQQRLGGQGPMVDVDTAKHLQNVLNIVLDQTNKLQQLPRSVWDRIAPPDNYQSHGQNNMPRNSIMFRDRYVQDMGPQDIVITAANREFGGNPPPMPLFNRPNIDRNKVMPAGMSSLETRGGQQNQHGRGMSERMQGRDYRKNNQGNDWNPLNQYDNKNMNKPASLMASMEPIVRPPSPKRPLLSPTRVTISPPRRYGSGSFSQQDNNRRQRSPSPRRQVSPPRRQATPPPRNNPHSEIFQRRPVAPQGGRQQSSDSSRRAISPPRREHSLSSGRQLSPSRRFPDDWDNGRSTMQQGNWNQRQPAQMQQRSLERNMPEKRWSNERPQNWGDSSSGNERFRQNANQDKRGGDGKDGMWMTGGGDVWNSKQMSMKPGMDRQWGGGGGNDGQGPSGDNWNVRSNDNYGQSNNRVDNWRNSGKGEKDWTELPDDAKDPWGDDAAGKSRWLQSEKASSSNWGRDEKMDQSWSNKGSSSSMSAAKPLWPNLASQSSNEPRWMSQNDTKRSGLSGNWPGNNYGMSSSLRPQNYSGFSQQQRQNAFGSNSFKDGR